MIKLNKLIKFLYLNLRVEEEAQTIINKLPKSIKDEIRRETYDKFIKDWIFFKSNFSAILIDNLKYIVREYRYSPND